MDFYWVRLEASILQAPLVMSVYQTHSSPTPPVEYGECSLSGLAFG